LIIPQGTIDSRSIEVLVVLRLSLLNLVSVEQWELLREVIGKVILQKVAHGSGVEREDGHHVGSIKLEERLVEHSWIWLVINNVNNLTQGLANIERLEKHELSQSDLVQLDFVKRPEGSLVNSCL